MPIDTDEVLLTPLDASRVLGVSTDSVRVYSRNGTLPTVRTVGGRRLFRRSDVDALAASRAREVVGAGKKGRKKGA